MIVTKEERKMSVSLRRGSFWLSSFNGPLLSELPLVQSDNLLVVGLGYFCVTLHDDNFDM